MGKKLIGLGIILIGILLLAGIVYVVFFDRNFFSDLFNIFNKEEVEQTEISNPPENNIDNQVVEKVPIDKTIKKISVEENKIEEIDRPKISSVQIDKDDLMRMAASFTERFGSYSNQSNFKNIVDLKIFMSQKMQRWADSYILDQRNQDISKDIYYGITTKAVAQEIKDIDYDAGSALVLVQTRRREAISSTNNITKSFSQDIIINFVKEKEAWKVNSATWQEE